MDPEKENFTWLIDQCRSYVTGKKPKLKCPDTLQIYNLQKKFNIPNFKVKIIKQETIQITLDHKYSNQSFINKSYELKIRNSGKFIHDFTYNISTYQQLSEIYCLGNPEDEMIPGKIIETQDFYLVIIYKINRVEVDEDGANRIFKNVKNLYFSQLRERTVEKNINLFIIITTPGSIITNADKMPQYLVDNLISRYLFSISVGQKIENELKIDVFGRLKINEYQQQYESIFKSINIDLPCDTYFTPKVIKNCTSPVNENDFKVTQRHVYDAAKFAEAKLSAEVMDDEKLNPTFIKRKRLMEIDAKFGSLCLAQGSNLRKYPKSIMQLPYIVLKLLKTNSSANELDLLNWDIGSSSNATFSLIKESIQRIKNGLVFSYFGAEKEEINNIDLIKSNKQTEKDTEHTIRLTLYHRVVPQISHDVAEELAMLGVDKSSNLSKKVHNYNEEKQLSFSLKDTNTKDIDDWLKSSDHFKRTSDTYLESEKYSSVGLAIKAIEKSSNNPNDSKFLKNKLERFLSSRIGRWAKLVSDIGIEISMTEKHSINYNGEWILKKLQNYNLYILFKPVKEEETTYFTLFWNNCDELFSRGRDDDSCWVTKNFTTNGLISWIDVISANPSKLVNWMKFESQLLCNSVFECENFETIFMNDEDLFLNEELNQKVNYARQSFLLSILVMINDRFALDELMSHARFMIMEGFKSLPLVPDPGKMLNKFPLVYRSRIEIWVAKKLVQTSKKIIKSFGFKCSTVDKKNGKLKWIGLFDPLLHIPFETPDQLINSMYYNYGKNKNERPLYSYTSLKLVSKILEYEDKLPLQNTYLGNKSRWNSKYRTHEFSPEVVRVMSENLGNKLEYKLGPSWKKILRDEIFNDLNEQDLESISTLKASASFTETYNGPGKRPRVAEAVKNLWLESGKKGWKAIHLLPIALKKTKESGGLHIDLFKKNQHGGLREIYVLSISSRIIQLVLEQISRTLCNQFKSEMITHSNLKLTTPADHCEQEKKMKKGLGSNITVCTSDDATKWNQGHFVTKFAIMLCQLTDPLFHPFIISALDLWTRKKILLPLDLIQSLTYNGSSSFGKLPPSKYMTKISQCYKGNSEEKWMSSGSNYIQTKTGMMQGILHLTSSLFHTLIQEFMKDEAKSILEKTFSNTDSVITVMQSSDDSGMIISLPTDNESDAITKMLAITTIFYIKHELGIMIGIYPSEKCTVGTINIYEFNSEFFIRGCSVRPTRKWVCAVNEIVQCDSLYARQEQNYPLISKILEGGGSGITAWFCQVSQAMLHYRLLGCSTSPLWSRYAEKMIQLLDPTLGFYYIDNPKFCGLTSCRFGLWLLSEKSYYLATKLKNILNTTAEKRLQNKEQLVDLYDIMGILNAGIVITSSTVSNKNNNNNKKWNNIVNNLRLDPQWMDKVENCPSILYQRAQNADEFDLRLAVKMHGSGISDLYQSSYVPKIITSGIAVLGKYVLEPSLKNNNNQRVKKTNESYGNNKILSEEEKNILFPLRDEYSSLVYLANKIDIKGSLEYQNLKKKRFNLTVFKSPIPHDYSLEKLVAWKWFNVDIPASAKVSQLMFDDYKKNIKWLKDTPQETLIESPFLNHIMMQNYFASTALNDHVIHLSAAPVTGTHKTSALKLFLSQNMWPNWKPVIKEKIEEVGDNLHILSQGIYMTVQSEMKKDIINTIIFKLLKYSDPLQAPSLKLQIYRSARPTLYLIQKLAVNLSTNRANVVDNNSLTNCHGLISKKTLTNWIIKCIDLSVGCFGTFALRQKNINGKNRGPFIWSGRMNDCLVRIHGDSYGNYDTCVTKIIVNTSKELRAVWPMFKQWAIDHDAILNIPRSYDTAKEDKVIARVLNNRLCPETLITTLGIPVVISNLILSKIDDAWFDIHTVLIDADQQSVRVKIKMKTDEQDNPNKFMTAVSCPMEYLEKSVAFLPINSYDCLKKETEFWHCFVTLKSLSVDQTDMLLEAIINNDNKMINSLGFNKETLLKKLRESFWYYFEKLYLGLENLSIEEKKNSDEMNMINNKFNNLQIDLKNLNGKSPLQKKLVEEFVLLDKEFHDEFHQEALEKDLKLYSGVQDDVFNVIESDTIGRFIDDIPKPLIRNWLEKIIGLFTLTILLLEFVEVSEAYRYVKPWKPHRHRLRRLPSISHRPPKRRYKKWRPQSHRHPRWNQQRYAPKYTDDEPYTIEIELPKYSNNYSDQENDHPHLHYGRGRRKHGCGSPYKKRNYNDCSIRSNSNSVSIENHEKPKLRIRISRNDNIKVLEPVSREAGYPNPRAWNKIRLLTK
ncbi:hypothetical protein HCN44_006098 [Aphidius gifuensis]|uniref:RdRp catalytic domain-containing protein n=1 Tax=Aphidius gifuensis TaxID=684658 RepID=A0A834Y4A3_APHGI|nr:hypothetical protein HCN44_006098 [Aphidius gifuensis]